MSTIHPKIPETVMRAAKAPDGQDLWSMAQAGPVLLLFLRHFG